MVFTPCLKIAQQTRGPGRATPPSPCLPDLYAALLLLFFCACLCANYLLRMLGFAQAQAHDAAVQGCLDPPCPNRCGGLSNPSCFGGLGSVSRQVRASSLQASWAACLPAIRARAPEVAARLVQELQASRSDALRPSRQHSLWRPASVAKQRPLVWGAAAGQCGRTRARARVASFSPRCQPCLRGRPCSPS